MSAVETRTCGQCGKFDPYRLDGEPIGTIKFPINQQGETIKVRMGVCRAPRGLSLGTRAEIMKCSHDELKNIPISLTEVKPEGVLT